MPVRRRNDKRRAAVSQNEEAWLRGERDCGFVEFKPHEKLLALWEKHSDPEVATWDLDENTRPVAINRE
jgi:hypothetical protein